MAKKAVKKTAAKPAAKKASTSAPPAKKKAGGVLKWEQTSGTDTTPRKEWHADDPEAKVHKRARMTFWSAKWRNGEDMFGVYREVDGVHRYLGSERTFEEAAALAESKVQKPMAMRDEPIKGDVPAFLMASEEERKAGWASEPAPRRAFSKANSKAAPPAPAVDQEAAARAARERQEIRAERAGAKSVATARASGKMNPKAVVNVKVRTNPRKQGTKQWDRFEVVMQYSGKTVEEFLRGGGDRQALEYAVQQGHAELKE